MKQPKVDGGTQVKVGRVRRQGRSAAGVACTVYLPVCLACLAQLTEKVLAAACLPAGIALRNQMANAGWGNGKGLEGIG